MIFTYYCSDRMDTWEWVGGAETLADAEQRMTDRNRRYGLIIASVFDPETREVANVPIDWVDIVA